MGPGSRKAGRGHHNHQEWPGQCAHGGRSRNKSQRNTV